MEATDSTDSPGLAEGVRIEAQQASDGQEPACASLAREAQEDSSPAASAAKKPGQTRTSRSTGVDLKALVARQQEYIQALAAQKRAQQEAEVAAQQRAQKLQQQLARRVLNKSLSSLPHVSTSSSVATSATSSRNADSASQAMPALSSTTPSPAASRHGTNARALGRSMSALSAVPQLPALVEPLPAADNEAQPTRLQEPQPDLAATTAAPASSSFEVDMSEAAANGDPTSTDSTTEHPSCSSQDTALPQLPQASASTGSTSISNSTSARLSGGRQQQHHRASNRDQGLAGSRVDKTGPAGSSRHKRRGRRAPALEGVAEEDPGEGFELPDESGDQPDSCSPKGAGGAAGAPAQNPGASLYYQSRAAAEAHTSMLSKVQGHVGAAGACYAGYLQWRLRNKVPDNVRVFCMGGTTGNHSAGIRAGLLARGWHENMDHMSSHYFDLKWTISPQDINYDMLWNSQVVNHFSKATCITTKVGLCHTLRDLAWYEAADFRAFYPRGYDLGNDTDRAAFVSDMRHCAAEAIVKRAAADGAVLVDGSVVSCSLSDCVSPSPGRGTPTPRGAGRNSTAQESVTMGSQNVTSALSSALKSIPMVDLPSLRLALRVCVARLTHEQFLRCESTAPGQVQLQQQAEWRQQQQGQGPQGAGQQAGVGLSGCSNTQERGMSPPQQLELSKEEWSQLLRHKCLNAKPPPSFPPQLSAAWYDRRFITSAHGDRSGATTQRGTRASQEGPERVTRGSMSHLCNDPASHSAAVEGSGQQDFNRTSYGAERGNSSRTRSEASHRSAISAGHSLSSGGHTTQDPGPGDEDDVVPSSQSTTPVLRSGEPSQINLCDHGGEESDVTPRAASWQSSSSCSADHSGAVSGEGTCGTISGGTAQSSHACSTGRVTPVSQKEGTEKCDQGDTSGNEGSETQQAVPDQPEQQVFSATEVPEPCLSPKLAPRNLSSSAQLSEGFDPDQLGGPQWWPVMDVTDAQICGMDGRAALALAHKVVAALEVASAQTYINGMNNVWIVKPAGKSRGRGIRLFNNQEALFEYVRGNDALELEWRWVAQKYVERPLIIHGRKFDIRQWVLVTDWNPLTVWFWDTCYLRFAADDYDTTNLDIFLHLSNNSIAKYYEGGKTDDITANGNMWDVPQFKSWLAATYGDPGLWESVIQPAMKHIVVCTTKCAQDMVKARKNSCQIYGYDFLIDDQLRVWLLEINSSPTMEASTPITTKLCAEVQEDILKVVVDLEDERSRRAAEGQRRLHVNECDTGRFRCIVEGGVELKQPTYTGLSLELKGKGINTRRMTNQQLFGADNPHKVPNCYLNFSNNLAAKKEEEQQQGPGGRPAPRGQRGSNTSGGPPPLGTAGPRLLPLSSFNATSGPGCDRDVSPGRRVTAAASRQLLQQSQSLKGNHTTTYIASPYLQMVTSTNTATAAGKQGPQQRVAGAGAAGEGGASATDAQASSALSKATAKAVLSTLSQSSASTWDADTAKRQQQQQRQSRLRASMQGELPLLPIKQETRQGCEEGEGGDESEQPRAGARDQDPRPSSSTLRGQGSTSYGQGNTSNAFPVPGTSFATLARALSAQRQRPDVNGSAPSLGASTMSATTSSVGPQGTLVPPVPGSQQQYISTGGGSVQHVHQRLGSPLVLTSNSFAYSSPAPLGAAGAGASNTLVLPERATTPVVLRHGSSSVAAAASSIASGYGFSSTAAALGVTTSTGGRVPVLLGQGSTSTNTAGPAAVPPLLTQSLSLTRQPRASGSYTGGSAGFVASLRASFAADTTLGRAESTAAHRRSTEAVLHNISTGGGTDLVQALLARTASCRAAGLGV